MKSLDEPASVYELRTDNQDFHLDLAVAFFLGVSTMQTCSRLWAPLYPESFPNKAKVPNQIVFVATKSHLDPR